MGPLGELGREPFAEPGQRDVVGRQERGVLHRPQLGRRQRRQGRLEQAADARLGMPGQPVAGLRAGGRVHQLDAVALEPLCKGAIRHLGILMLVDRNDLDGESMAAQPADDLQRRLPLVVLGALGDRPEALQQGHRVLGLQGIERQAADPRQVLG